MRSFGADGSTFIGDLGFGKEGYYLTTISAPIDPGLFKQFEAVDHGFTTFIKFKYTDQLGKLLQNAACMSRLATGAIALLNPADCEKQLQK